MTPRTIFTLTFGSAALLVSSLLGFVIHGNDGKMLAFVFVATTSTTLLAHWLAPRTLLNAQLRLILGAAIPILPLLLVCILQNWLASAPICNGETLSGGGLEYNPACFEQELAFVGFMFLAPIFMLVGATLAVIAVALGKHLTHPPNGAL